MGVSLFTLGVELVLFQGLTLFYFRGQTSLTFGGVVAKVVGANLQWGEFTTNQNDKCNSTLAGHHIALLWISIDNESFANQLPNTLGALDPRAPDSGTKFRIERRLAK